MRRNQFSISAHPRLLADTSWRPTRTRESNREKAIVAEGSSLILRVGAKLKKKKKKWNEAETEEREARKKAEEVGEEDGGPDNARGSGSRVHRPDN